MKNGISGFIIKNRCGKATTTVCVKQYLSVSIRRGKVEPKVIGDRMGDAEPHIDIGETNCVIITAKTVDRYS